jgi:hypothetical protein
MDTEGLKGDYRNAGFVLMISMLPILTVRVVKYIKQTCLEQEMFTPE